MTVSVVIVTHGEKAEFVDCLQSLRNQAVDEIIVVDNNSNEAMKKTLSETPGIKVIYNDGDFGLSRANNIGIAAARGNYVMTLNPDTYVYEGVIKALSDYLNANPSVGIVGPRILNSRGQLEFSFFGIDEKWNLVGRIPDGWLHIVQSRRGAVKDKEETRPLSVSFVTGLMMGRKELLRYDDRFFLAVEDVVDLCRRVRESGYDIVYNPLTTIKHLEGRGHKGFGSIFWFYQGKLIYQMKYGSTASLYLLRFELVIDAAIKLGIATVGYLIGRTKFVFVRAFGLSLQKLLTTRTRALFDEGLEITASLERSVG